jgi:aminoglycoside phosphotransferase (APT) family kinase protein
MGNLVWTSKAGCDRHALIDLDDLALGCPEIDLAPAATSYQRFSGVAGSWSEFRSAYETSPGAEPIDEELLTWFVKLRQLTMLSWLFTLWDLRPETRNELTHRMTTLDKVAIWNPL